MSQAMTQHLSQRQDMVLAPQMYQALDILQLQRQDLEQRLIAELAVNPVLELEEFADHPDEDAPPDPDLMRPDEIPPPDDDLRDTELADPDPADAGLDSDPDPDADPDDFDFDPDAMPLRFDSAYETPHSDDAGSTAHGSESDARTPPEADGAYNDETAGTEEDFIGQPAGDYSRLDDVDADWDEIHEDRTSRPASSARAGEDDGEFDPLDHIAARPCSFQEDLRKQLDLSPLDARTRALAEGMLATLDDAGYLSLSFAVSTLYARSFLDSEGDAPRDLRDLRERLRRQLDRDPERDPGGAARTLIERYPEILVGNHRARLREILLDSRNMLAERPERDPGGEIRLALDRFLEKLDDGRLPKIARDLGVPPKTIARAAAAIQALPPQWTVPADFPPPPASDAEIKAALDAVQSLEPAGVGARDLSECLRLQLGRDPELDPDGVADAIVSRFLEDFAANRLPKIARSLDVPLEAVKRGASTIRRLFPNPGRARAEPAARAVRPDALVRETDDGGLEATLPAGMPVEISDFYVALFDRSRRARILRERLLADPMRSQSFRALESSAKGGGQEGKRYRQLYEAATSLLKAVSMRDQTLLRTVRETARRQRAYLLGAAEAPTPLMMQEVAKAVGYDDSTISRAVKDKYIDTPRGVMPLRDLFTRAAMATGGRAFGRNRRLAGHAARAGAKAAVPGTAADGAPGPQAVGAGPEATPALVMHRLRAVIEAEDPKAPLKDGEIQERMAALGLPLARRTVAHYRQAMGLPSHSKRREY